MTLGALIEYFVLSRERNQRYFNLPEITVIIISTSALANGRFLSTLVTVQCLVYIKSILARADFFSPHFIIR